MLFRSPEVLLWKEYSSTQSIKHDTPYRCKVGCADGYTRTFAESFLMKNGLPIYASGDYKGDVTIDNVKSGRDERLQLFVWGESDLMDSDPVAPGVGKPFKSPAITEATEKDVVLPVISHVSTILTIITKLPTTR